MIQVIKAARRAQIVAVAHLEGDLHIWDLGSGQRVLEFKTVFDHSVRLAISHSGETVVAANWKSGPKAGVACYDCRTGQLIWHRSDIAQVQHMRFSEHGPWIWCDIESKPVLCLDANTGVTLTTWPTVQHIFDGPFSPRLLLVGQVSYSIGTVDDHVEIPRLNDSFRDAAFTPSGIILCERDVVRCVAAETGQEHWRYLVPEGDYMTRLSFQSDLYVYGIRSSAPGPGRVVRLMRFSLDGASSELCSLGSNMPYDGFGDGVFITVEGQIISLQSGEIQKQLAFT